MKFSEAIKLLEEGKKVRLATWDKCEYIYLDEFGCMLNYDGSDYEPYIITGEWEEYKECEHEWAEYTQYNSKTGETKHYRECVECGLQEEIEPTDNTKIEELNIKLFSKEHFVCSELERGIMDNLLDIQDKLNEVIRKINRGNNNV